MAYYLRIVDNTVNIQQGQLTAAQFELGMIEHHSETVSISRSGAGYAVNIAGKLVGCKTAKRAREIAKAARVVKIEEVRRHGVAPRGAKELREAGWKPLGK